MTTKATYWANLTSVVDGWWGNQTFFPHEIVLFTSSHSFSQVPRISLQKNKYIYQRCGLNMQNEYTALSAARVNWLC